MSVTARQIELVQSTFQMVAPIADQAAGLFYTRLFEIAPHTRSLFAHADMNDQGKKLMQMIATAVHSLNNLDGIVPAVMALGKRHAGYRVTEDMYQTVGTALLWTLEQGLGEAFTPEVREAWTVTYTVLAETAIAGARQAA